LKRQNPEHRLAKGQKKNELIESPTGAGFQVIFLTDRNDEGGADWRTRFGSRLFPRWKLTCGTVHFRSSSFREVGQTYDDGLISVNLGAMVRGIDECANFVRDTSRTFKADHILVLLHGYWNTFPSAVSRAIALAEDIQFDGLVLIWSWPSQGIPSAYDDDGKAVSWSTDHFIDFMSTLTKNLPRVNFDFLAHSMGNRILVEMAAKGGRALVFAAPDVATDDFTQKMAGYQRFRTLYTSEKDRAIQLSNYLHSGKGESAGRAGGQILFVTGVEPIDAIVRGHSYIYEDPRALRDFGKLIRTQDNASHRGLTERRKGPNMYWVINP
jgi:hypothetical protein